MVVAIGDPVIPTSSLILYFRLIHPLLVYHTTTVHHKFSQYSQQ
jgi:hypothetical protein